ncbi:MAG: hypothetical protein K0U47_11045 [Epsilonproteobacteria bacterium]|nr:hypothetical protein [Campylobacterota bacterium]
MKYIISMGIILILMTGCGSSSSPTNQSLYLDVPDNALCSGDEFYRLKTKACLPLKNPSWDFKDLKSPLKTSIRCRVAKSQS